MGGKRKVLERAPGLKLNGTVPVIKLGSRYMHSLYCDYFILIYFYKNSTLQAYLLNILKIKFF